MEPGEIASRIRTSLRQAAWRSRRGDAWPTPQSQPRASRPGSFTLGTSCGRPAELLAAAAADILSGHWEVLGRPVDLSSPDPDWHADPLTGRRADPELYFAGVPYRDDRAVGSVKHLWEVSRLQHLTVLAGAYALTGDAAVAQRAIDHTGSWCRANPPLQGVHWISGIEIALRLIAWAWTRRLLSGHPGVSAAFEDNPLFRTQLHAHQAWLAAFPSTGSSANNHAIAEAAGLLAAAAVFPCFPESAGWLAAASGWLEREAGQQTFADGLNRELASEYHVFVLELLLLAGMEADLAAAPLSPRYWDVVRRMADALAANLDVTLQAPRQGDGDHGRAIIVDSPRVPAVLVVLHASARIFGPAPWWPALPGGSIEAELLARHVQPRAAPMESRLLTRPNEFPDAGVSILRDLGSRNDEIWCRFDHGPFGFLSIAAHAHADALSFELRVGGAEVFVDPGTYCYHTEPDWRRYFRSTRAHNALEIAGRDQADPGGPFMWKTHPRCLLLASGGLDDGDVATVEASHDGYAGPPVRARHRRKLMLNRSLRELEVQDSVQAGGALAVLLAFHLHPRVECRLREGRAVLRWRRDDTPQSAIVELPAGLDWKIRRGETQPIAGWYSSEFGRREAAVMLAGSGTLQPDRLLVTRIRIIARAAELAAYDQIAASAGR